MILTHLSLTNFRSFSRLDLELPRRVVLLTGNNAQGKTSVLEAIYFLAAFTSFQTNMDRQLINFIEARKDLGIGRLVGEYKQDTAKHRLEIRLVLEGVGATGQRLRKEILLDGVKRPMMEGIGHFKAVIFVPQMTEIIEGGPEHRRRYLNLALSQAFASYPRQLSEYAEAINQRNALLKMLAERGGDASQLDFWDGSISKTGSAIIFLRIQAVREIESIASRIHKELTKGVELMRLHYQPSYDPLQTPEGQISLALKTPVQRSGLSQEEIRIGFLEALKKNRAEDIRRGMTSIGPHRDELRFHVNGIDLTDYGSRGQVRTALLALKLAEMEWIKERTNQCPVLLLDEVLAELDAQRRKDLLGYLGNVEQTLLTTTDLTLFPAKFVEQAKVWLVDGGTIRYWDRESEPG